MILLDQEMYLHRAIKWWVRMKSVEIDFFFPDFTMKILLSFLVSIWGSLYRRLIMSVNQLKFSARFVKFYLCKIEMTGLKRKDYWKIVIWIPMTIFLTVILLSEMIDTAFLWIEGLTVLTYLTPKTPILNFISFNMHQKIVKFSMSVASYQLIDSHLVKISLS